MQTTWLEKQEEIVQYSTTIFRQLLDSLARPGKINQLNISTLFGEFPVFFSNAAQTSVKVNTYALGALLTLLDSEVSFCLAANGTWLDSNDAIVQWVAVRSGAKNSSPDTADFAFFCDGIGQSLIAALNPGSVLEPEISTTAFYCVDRITNNFDSEIKLELSGPGIEHNLALGVDGLDKAEIEAIIQTRQSYPLGIDVYLIDRNGLCVGLPRTTRLWLR